MRTAHIKSRVFQNGSEESPSNYAADESCRSFTTFAFLNKFLTVFHGFAANLCPTFNEPPLTSGNSRRRLSPAASLGLARRVLEYESEHREREHRGAGLKGRGASALRARRAPWAKRRRRFPFRWLSLSAFSGFDKILIRFYMSLMPLPPLQSCFLSKLSVCRNHENIFQGTPCAALHVTLYCIDCWKLASFCEGRSLLRAPRCIASLF